MPTTANQTVLDTVSWPAGAIRTNTGLDTLTATILADPGLNLRIDDAEITEGAIAASQMNRLIVSAIKATGIANDGDFDAADIHSLADYINTNNYAAFLRWHGNDENNSETAFHLVQSDGAVTRMFGDNAVDTVADGLYHLGFGTDGQGNLLNEDGNANARVETVAFWLNELLADDLAAGTLENAGVRPLPVGTTGTGLDRLVTIITTDEGLLRRVPLTELAAGARAANEMNKIVVDAIEAEGYANDGVIRTSEVMGLADRIGRLDYAEWLRWHGDDENNSETGFHLVQNDGAETRLYAENAVDTVADGLYHLGFGYNAHGNLINEDGNANARVETVADWLNNLLAADLRDGSLANDRVDPLAVRRTGTGLDRLLDGIAEDNGLNERISVNEIADGLSAAAQLNKLIIDTIKAKGYANDGTLTSAEVMGMADHIRTTKFGLFSRLHGDDENNEETGFHLVQNDGAQTRLFGRALADTVADGLYHLGFGYAHGRLINEDGDANVRIEEVADWLNRLLARDLAGGKLANAAVDPIPDGTTGTGIDRFVEIIARDKGLADNISVTEIAEGARAADTLGHLIVDGIRATGIANDGGFSEGDIKMLADHIAARNYGVFVAAHGNDENNSETAFHLVQNDGARTRLYGENAVDTVIDGIFHLGFGYANGRLVNEDGDANQTLADVAYWLEDILADDIAAGTLHNVDHTPYVAGSTGTGLDGLVNMITADLGLQRGLHTADIARAAAAADGMNQIILRGIWATGIANDGSFSEIDLRDLDQWIARQYGSTMRALHGVDDNGGTNFSLTQTWMATSPLFGEDGINHVADNIYHLGFGTIWGAIRNEDGGYGAELADVAGWLGRLLAPELRSGALGNKAFDPHLPADGSVLPVPRTVTVDGNTGFHEAGHRAALAVANGTVAFSFSLRDGDAGRTQALFSKDASGNGAGHVTAWVDAEGEIWVRVQDGTNDHYLTAGDTFIVQDRQTYEFALTFGAGGVGLWIDGAKVDVETAVTTGWTTNREDVVIGGTGWGRTPTYTDAVWDRIDGTISDFGIWDRALDRGEIAGLAGLTGTSSGKAPALPSQNPNSYFAGLPDHDGWAGVSGGNVRTLVRDGTGRPDRMNGTDFGDRLSGLGGNDTLDGKAGDDRLDGGIGRDVLLGGEGNDSLLGGTDDDRIAGGAGEDTAAGGAGRDRFVFGSGDGDDVIADFDDTADRIEIGSGANALADLTLRTVAGDLVIAFDDVTVTLDGVTLAGFDTRAIVFA